MIFPYSCLPSGVGAPCPSWLGICFADILAPPPLVGGGKWCLLYKALPSPTAAARWDQPQKLPWSRYLDPLSFPHIPSSLVAPHWRLWCQKFTKTNTKTKMVANFADCIFAFTVEKKWWKAVLAIFVSGIQTLSEDHTKEVACQISIWRHDHYDQYPPFPSRLVSCPVISIISGLIA